MAKVPLPERGQPLDVSYIYELSTALNQLSDQVSTATYNYTTIDTVAAGKQNIKTSEARLIGGYVVVATDSNVTAAQTSNFSYTYPSDFKYIPIVTASPINSGKTAAGEDITVVLTDITRSSVSGFVKYNASGKASTIVNLIIIGIPN